MKSIDKFFKILNLLEVNSNLRLKEISDILNLDKATVHRFLKILLEQEFVRKNFETNRYSLGLRFLNISTKIIEGLNIKTIAQPYLAELKELTGETIHLAMFDGSNVIYIDKIESTKSVRIGSRIGSKAQFYCTALGKTILSFQDSKVKIKIFDDFKFIPMTKNTITDKKTLLQELNEIKRNGYGVDNSENKEEVCCIAAPIFNHDKNVNYAISISAIKTRTNVNKLLEYKEVLIEKCNIISKKMGFPK